MQRKIVRAAKSTSGEIAHRARLTTRHAQRVAYGTGLYLWVRSRHAKFRPFRYTRRGRMREIGRGPAKGRTAVSLSHARAKAREL
jgi:hypothetical protein